jgi:hypothetical protein
MLGTNLAMQDSFAVILLVGPGELEIERARDTVESLVAYEGSNFTLFLVDDSPSGRNLAESIAPQLRRASVGVLKNPRNGEGCGWGSGAAVGVLGALQEASKAGPFRFFLKIDTDTLVIGPFSDRISEAFACSATAGVLGVYQFSPQRQRDRTSTPALEKLLRQVTIWRRTPAGGPAIQLGFWGKYWRIRNVIRQAIMNGYRLGEHCAGGGYAISPNCVAALERAGLLKDPRMWLKVPMGEDGIIALCAASVEFALKVVTAEDALFAIKHKGLQDTPERLANQRYSIIHSVKDYKDLREADIRAYFRKRRAKI